MGKIVIVSVLVFLIVVLLLVSILLFARKKLVPQGKVKININDKKELEVESGSSILATLAAEKVFYPQPAEDKALAECVNVKSWKEAARCCRPKSLTSRENNNKNTTVWAVRSR